MLLGELRADHLARPGPDRLEDTLRSVHLLYGVLKNGDAITQQVMKNYELTVDRVVQLIQPDLKSY